jgi:hypothetical protein
MKEKFEQLIAESVKPLLKSQGFSKKGLNFYKNRGDLVFMFNFQKNIYNDFSQVDFFVNCGIHSTAIDTVIGKSPLLQPKEYECYFRKRISSIIGSVKDGYSVVENTDLKAFGQTLTEDLKVVVALYDTIKSTNDFTNLMIEENGLNNYLELFEYLLMTDNKTDLTQYVQQLCNVFAGDERWDFFENHMMLLLEKHPSKEYFRDIFN